MKRHTCGSSRGLTLLELLCVIAGIAILLSLIANPISRALKKARKLNADVSQGQTNIIKEQEPGGALSAE